MSKRGIVASAMRRIANTADAASQLFNCACLPRPFDTQANESVSGRCYREGTVEGRGGAWSAAQRAIDAVWRICGTEGHCHGAYMKDRGAINDQ